MMMEVGLWEKEEEEENEEKVAEDREECTGEK